MRQLQSTSAAVSKRMTRTETAENATKTAGGLLPQTRERILSEILGEIGRCGEADLARTVARRLNMSARVIDAVLIGYLLEFRSRVAMLETSMISAAVESKNAGLAVWAEFRGVA